MKFILRTHLPVFLLSILFWSVSAFAATITVTTTADDALSTTTPNGVCSLREAIINANNNASTYADCSSGTTNDIISLTGGETYFLTIKNTGASSTTPTSGTDEDYSATGDLDIRSSLTISVAGTGDAIIDGGGIAGSIDRIFEILSGDVFINNCTIQGGYLVAPTGDVYGGGIYGSVAGATLTLTDSTISGNTAISSAAVVRGGGIAVTTGYRLMLDGSHVWDNIATGSTYVYGGGVFVLSNATSSSTLIMSNDSDVLRNRATANTAGFGAGILVWTRGTLTLSDSDVKDNVLTAAYAQGGGIYSGGATATLTGSTLSGNTATGTTTQAQGAGLFIVGTGTLTDSTISGNTATGGTYAYGGGLYSHSSSTVTIISSTLSGNEANATTFAYGGGIYPLATLTVTNSTLSGNTASTSSSTQYARGGGIYGNSTTSINHSTIAGNEVENTTSVSLAQGGGIYSTSASVPSIKSSLIVDNTTSVATNSGADCYGSINSYSYNLFENIYGCTLTAVSGSGDVSGSYSLLSDLAENGGSTKTHAFEVSSTTNLAIDAGSCTTIVGVSVTTDQRGKERGSTCDSGAYEMVCGDDNWSGSEACEETVEESVETDERCTATCTVEHDADSDTFYAEADDCDDTDATIYPGAEEICDDEVDSDCDGEVGASTFYIDADGDGYGSLLDEEGSSFDCGEEDSPSGYAGSNSDCNDDNASINSSIVEICNGVDDDCDGVVDNGLTFISYYADTDTDGYGDASSTISACSEPSSYVTNSADCDDTSALAYTGTSEICGDGVDNDCDGVSDAGSTWYEDDDGDGYGDAADSSIACAQPIGSVANANDCNDTVILAYTGATEGCGDGVDNDCDGVTDEGDTWYDDDDGDTFGDAADVTIACEQPENTVSNATDCNDNNATINPDSLEVAGNDIDDNCDGVSEALVESDLLTNDVTNDSEDTVDAEEVDAEEIDDAGANIDVDDVGTSSSNQADDGNAGGVSDTTITSGVGGCSLILPHH